jgi:hypothetical protein
MVQRGKNLIRDTGTWRERVFGNPKLSQAGEVCLPAPARALRSGDHLCSVPLGELQINRQS